MDQPKITIHLKNSIIFNALASDTASVAYVQTGNSFILEDCLVRDNFAPTSSVLFSSSAYFKLIIIKSTLTCKS